MGILIILIAKDHFNITQIKVSLKNDDYSHLIMIYWTMICWSLIELVQIGQKLNVWILAEFSNKDVWLEISDCLPFSTTQNYSEKKNQQKFIKKSVKIQQIH
jgi:hypothetical protein